MPVPKDIELAFNLQRETTIQLTGMLMETERTLARN